MYCPPLFAANDPAECYALMRAHPLAHLVRLQGGSLAADAVVLWPDAEEGVLRGHVARANPLSTCDGAEVLAIFGADDAYVSPGWLPGKAEHGRVVPTWNYRVVHAHGRLRVVDDAAWLRAQMAALTEAQEGALGANWQVGDAPADFIAAMLKAVVGVEIAISTLEGKDKLSQNRGAAERAGIRQGLAARGDAASAAVAAAMDRIEADQGERS
ncbi:FMN-binding negative transcriptional regulator [Crenobacter intestini]|uniref:FMN-binding negative transcriptional regulator n=1 Tax=Crenobacter intestini TaxID=2563443 RepID=A0A4T0V113_9NEIS|nr:FMN-binding negative transcriptional regulator [Crenobacter intestini]TIC84775.1 FMN-binding negative transcriptional regulator [Crenobacter intestini]